MLNLLVFITALLSTIIANNSLASASEYTRDYEYTATKYDSEHTSRLYAIDGVKRTLIDELGTYVQSVVKVNQNALGESYMSSDMVTLSAGITRLKLLDEDWDRVRYYVKASMQADEDEVLRSLKELQKNNELQSALRDSMDELNKARNEIQILQTKLDNPDSRDASLLSQYQQAARDFESEAQFQQAMTHFIKGEFDAMQEIIRSLADENYPKAQARLGYIYERGIGVEQDYKKAASWYIRAMQNGSAKAYAHYGFLYSRGLGVPRDNVEAIKYFRKAAELDSGLGYAGLGNMYQTGAGVERDLDQAFEYYQKAADRGNAFGIARLGFMYQKGWGVSRDIDKAVENYQVAANKGNPHALARLGNLHIQGLGVEKDYEKAYRYLLAAVDRGNPLAYANLGILYENGYYVDRDVDKAVELYRKGAAMKNTQAEFSLGQAYHKGISVQKNRQEAIKWYRLAAEKEHPKAQKRLDKLLNR